MNTSIRNFLASTALLALTSVPAIAQDETFLEGGHYDTLQNTQAVSTGDKIEVLELFWYRCPHCYTLEVPLQEWRREFRLPCSTSPTSSSGVEHRINIYLESHRKESGSSECC